MSTVFVSTEDVEQFFSDNFPFVEIPRVVTKPAYLTLEAVRDWCEDQYGPSGRSRAPGGFIVHHDKAWVFLASAFYFKRVEDAMWFKMRWA